MVGHRIQPASYHISRLQTFPITSLCHPLLQGIATFVGSFLGVHLAFSGYNPYSLLRRQPNASVASLHSPIERATVVGEPPEMEESRVYPPGQEPTPTQPTLHLPTSPSAAAVRAQNAHLINDLNRLLQDQKKILPANDSTRADVLSHSFHHKFVAWLTSTLGNRSSITADEVYCRARVRGRAAF